MVLEEIALKDLEDNTPVKVVVATNALQVAQTGELPAGTKNIGDVNLLNVANSVINPATEDKQDTLIANQTNATQQSKITDGSLVADVDDVSSVLTGITSPHAHVHEAERYVVQEGIQLNNASKEYLITTPDTTKWAHMTIDVIGGQDTSIRLVEGTGKTGGTSMVEINRNRNSGNNAGVIITHTPSGTEGGITTLFTCQFGIPAAGGGRGGGGGAQVGRAEFILKQNTKYSLTVTALSANDNNICVSIDWYEHVNVA